MNNQRLFPHTFLYCLFTLCCFLSSHLANAQNWQLVWSDEFNGSISSDWVFETGTGSGGWGNNELQYYRQQNATIENGQLVITARRENFGGSVYTSARLKTQGRMSITYGRIEARLAIPTGSGLWPAFWMLGESISSVSWPYCGEIDIMEHINTEPVTYGTIHWQDHNDSYANYSGSTNVSVENFHVYAIEWDASAIRWYVDNNLYHEASIANGINGTQEFHDDFFLLLNLAVGGNWPGFTIDESRLPAQYRIDYVRVYQDANGSGSSSSGGGNGSSSGGSSSNYGIEVLDSDSILFYVDISSGFADVHYRLNGGGQLNYAMTNANGRKEFAVNGMNNGDVISYWFTYQNPNTGLAVDTSESTYTHGSSGGSSSGGTGSSSSSSGGAFSFTTQAESYSAMNGVQTENTSDSGGGQNVGWIDSGDWMAYANIAIPASGTYTIEYRVASINGGQLSQDLNGGSTVLGSVTIPATGGWQTWTTVSQTVQLNQGTYDFGIYASTGGWNINWWRITAD